MRRRWGESLWTVRPQSQGLFVHEPDAENVMRFTSSAGLDLFPGDDAGVRGLAWARAVNEPIDRYAGQFTEARHEVVGEHGARLVAVIRVFPHAKESSHFLGFFCA